MLKRCEGTNLVLNQEKCHFMVKEGIVLGHKVSRSRIEEFDIEIHYKKGVENLVADHLSRLENPDLRKLTKAEIKDLFPEEQLMTIYDKGKEPWHYFWDEPFPFKKCADQIVRRCVAGNEVAQILRQCRSGPSGGHHGIATTARKVFEPELSWPNFFQDVCKLVCSYDACQRSDNISSRDKTPQKSGIPKALISDRGTHFCNYQMERAMKRFLQINELDELRHDSYESSISYKERTKRWYDKRIKTPTKYEKGDKLLLFNSRMRLFPRKLKSRWYRPFSVSKDMKNGAIELHHEDGN
ncbi:hypothetical protein Tco_1125828 [Tanacetum coccineum]